MTELWSKDFISEKEIAISIQSICSSHSYSNNMFSCAVSSSCSYYLLNQQPCFGSQSPRFHEFQQSRQQQELRTVLSFNNPLYDVPNQQQSVCCYFPLHKAQLLMTYLRTYVREIFTQYFQYFLRLTDPTNCPMFAAYLCTRQIRKIDQFRDQQCLQPASLDQTVYLCRHSVAVISAQNNIPVIFFYFLPERILKLHS